MQPQLNFHCREVGEQPCPAWPAPDSPPPWPFNSVRCCPRPPPAPTRDAATPSVPYFCPMHVAMATQERPQFPLLYFKRCPNCRVSDDVQWSTNGNSSSASSSSSPAVVVLPPPPWPFNSVRCRARPPPAPTRDAATPSVPYFCPMHVAMATQERPQFPLLYFKRCPNCRVSDDVQSSTNGNSSSASSSSSPAVVVLPPPPPPPPLLSHFDPWDNYLFRSSRTSSEDSPPPEYPTLPWRPPSPPSPTLESPSDHRGGGRLPLAAPRETFEARALATVTVSDDAAPAAACAVCTDALPLGAAACQLPCGHLYHSDCIVPWLALRSSCPVCRRSVPMFAAPTSTTEEITTIQPSPPPLDIDPQLTATPRRRSLPVARRIRVICRRMLNYMEMSRGRQPN
ncbi:hypothetical protein GUJ93_ZPchr0002g25189 [Zizania palustris]|uniref:RING-type domain-containing protein n=1 Tax=Zizania palustris TaxID=103762 RepID=A0A8J5S782_ZIZPA|nr:hypothetical protein GUJ93_ZPchr0002g25189 [Zizania palustris]